jgi:phosphopantetheinyl transferase (holo-ACP synthase)
MIDNIGIDLVENKRIEKSINQEFLNTVLTEKELSIYNKKKGKNALLFLFQEIEILNKKNGAPYAIFKNYKLLVSISHENNNTIAEAILIK